MRQADVRVGPVVLHALLFIGLFLAALSEGFRNPVIVLITVPFVILGALVGLATVDDGINPYGAIGIIALIGLVARNGIITEVAGQQRDQGLPMPEALITAAAVATGADDPGPTILRATPLMPDRGSGRVGRSRIGAVIVGCMTFGALLTLAVVPSAYRLISSRTRPAPPAPHPRAAGSGGLVAAPGA